MIWKESGLNQAMKTKSKVVLGVLAATLIVGPFLVPVQTSGTLTAEEAIATVPGLEANFLEVLDHKVHYEIAGDPNSNRLVLLLHGFGASSFSWEKVIEPLAMETGALVIAYDRAGFGFTERPQSWAGDNPYGSEGQKVVISKFIEKFGQGKQVVLVGHSAGGLLAADYAISFPDKLSQLVLFAPAIRTGGGLPESLAFLLDIPQINHLGPLLVSTISASGLEIIYRSYHNQDLITESTLNGYTAPLKIAGWERGFWQFVKAPRKTNLELGKLSTPTLIITGDDDQIVETANSIELSQQLSNISELVVVPNSGHLTNEENPREFVAALKDFIE
jgi:pimeloyl-ACP methyl ester carboxylesterase